ncbi:MAG: PaaI family thioesterase [Desulfosoma sp.]|uniref:PaaI family thioesterase n=1 Tax=Desulfosoma sp. TaxID=2603217 RepID=UPI0040494744
MDQVCEHVARRAQLVPAVQWLGMEVLEAHDGKARVRLPYKAQMCNSRGMVHGGLVSTLADFAGAIALLSLLNEKDFTPTIEMSVNYLGPGRSDLTAEARVLKCGSRVGTAYVQIVDAEGGLTAVALASYALSRA